MDLKISHSLSFIKIYQTYCFTFTFRKTEKFMLYENNNVNGEIQNGGLSSIQHVSSLVRLRVVYGRSSCKHNYSQNSIVNLENIKK